MTRGTLLVWARSHGRAAVVCWREKARPPILFLESRCRLHIRSYAVFFSVMKFILNLWLRPLIWKRKWRTPWFFEIWGTQDVSIQFRSIVVYSFISSISMSQDSKIYPWAPRSASLLIEYIYTMVGCILSSGQKYFYSQISIERVDSLCGGPSGWQRVSAPDGWGGTYIGVTQKKMSHTTVNMSARSRRSIKLLKYKNSQKHS
jgi:hypothetical protein